MSDSPTQRAASDVVPSPWPDHLDALIAAPDHHTLLFENDRVRVLDPCIRPGDRTRVHTHRWPAVLYLVSWRAFIRYDDTGSVLLDSGLSDLGSPDTS